MWSWPLTSIYCRVKNAWSCTSTPMAWYLVKYQRHVFTFTLMVSLKCDAVYCDKQQVLVEMRGGRPCVPLPLLPVTRVYLRVYKRTPCELSILVFWVETSCGRVGRYQRFGETHCLHLQGWRLQSTSSPPWESQVLDDDELHFRMKFCAD
jgi:hypothetical protein